MKINFGRLLPSLFSLLLSFLLLSLTRVATVLLSARLSFLSAANGLLKRHKLAASVNP